MTAEEIEIAKEKARIKMKKKKRKRTKRPYYELIADVQVQRNIRHNINIDDKIPENFKTKFQKIELNPLALCLSGLPYTIMKQELKHYFNTFLKTMYPHYEQKGIDPVKKVDVGTRGKYGVLYLVDKETADILVDKIQELDYTNYKIKIERPKGFFSKIYKFRDEDDIFDKELLKQQHKLYIGNIPTYIKETELRKIIEAMGPVKVLNLVKDYVNDMPVSRGYAFAEYADPRVTEKAIERLNGLAIGEKTLRVQRVTDEAPDAYQEVESDEEATKIKTRPRYPVANEGGSYLNNFYKIEDEYVKAMISLPQSTIIPSRVIQILNTSTAEDLLEEDFYQDLKEDVQQVCKEFGIIERIEIPRPDMATGLCCPAVGKVFVKFLYMSSSKHAQYKLNGRPYNGRTVIVTYFNEDEFEQGEFLEIKE